MGDSPRESLALRYAVYDIVTSAVPANFTLPADLSGLLTKKVTVHTFKKEKEVCVFRLR